MAEDLTEKDAVFLPAFTYNATCNAVITAGATPVYVDVDTRTCNISVQSLRKTVKSVVEEGRLRPAVVMAVDLYGSPAPYRELKTIAGEFGMLILADAAQSFGGSRDGIRVGRLVDITATLFYPSKTLGGFGDGGALFTDNEERFEKWQSVRWHGTDETRSESVRVGINGRLGSVQCEILLAKLAVFDEEMKGRKRVAKWYMKRLDSKNGILEGHAWGLFTVILDSIVQRERARAYLKEKGVATGVYYPKPLHQHKAFRSYVLRGQKFENSKWLAERVLSLPISPYMTEEQTSWVCNALLDAVRTSRAQIDQQAKL